MSERNITRRKQSELTKGETDWARVDATTEEEIERQAREDALLWTGDETERGEWVAPDGTAEEVVSLRLEADVVEHFRARHPDYRRRMQDVLRRWVHRRQKV